MSILSVMLTAFLVMDPLGNVPLVLVLLEPLERKRRRLVLLRESLFALGLLMAFLVAGQYILGVFGISESAMGIAGGIVLLVIALRMIFPQRDRGILGNESGDEPFFVPIAIPLIAGPTALVTVVLFASQYPDRLPGLAIAIGGAWLLSTIILVGSESLRRWLRPRGLIALERLMGMILMTVAVQMLLSGIDRFLGR